MAWEITGNSGTNPEVNFLGTTDNQPLVIKAGGVAYMRISPTGHIDIGGSQHSSVYISHSNGDIGLDHATLRIENPHGYHSIQSFSFANNEKASIRADINGNLVLNAKSSIYWLGRDFGDKDSITIVPRGGVLGVKGHVKAWGIIFEDGSEQTTAILQGPEGKPGRDGRDGAQGPQGPAGVRTTTSAVCGPTPCNFACGSGLVAEQIGPCFVTSDTVSCRATQNEYCCVCHA